MPISCKTPIQILAAFVVMALGATAQSTPTIDPPYTNAVVVSGTISPGSGPVSIYDISYPAKTKLGDSQSVDAQGNFAVSVKPALIEGHQIIAVDSKGVASPPVTVTKHPLDPSAPSN